MAMLGDVGLGILQGRPATCGPRGTYFLATTIDQLDFMLAEADSPRIFLLRCPAWFRSQSYETSQQFIDNIPTHTSHELDVQDLGLSVEEDMVGRMSLSTVQTRWRETDGNVSSTPLNLLNLSCPIDPAPSPVYKHFRMLYQACQAVELENVDLLLGDSLLAKQSRKSYITTTRRSGGETITTLPNDVQSCLRFHICAQAGAISGWHLDILAPYTCVVLAGNTEEEEDEDVLKYWAIIDFHNLTEEEQGLVRKQFAEEGQFWLPKPEWISVIPLIRGDCLIMPPGTIHAPITITNCFFRGGMFWDKRIFVKHTLPWWNYICQHRNTVSNEDPPVQILAILDWVKRDIRTSFEEYKISEADVDDVIRICDTIRAFSTPCTCKKPGKKNFRREDCPCYAAQFRCMRYCKCG